jgi:hypothetical protein
MKSVLIATIGTRDLMFQVSTGIWLNIGDDRMQNGEIIGEQAEIMSDLGVYDISFRDLTNQLLSNISTYIKRIQPPIIGKIFYDRASEIEKIYLIATDQKEEVQQREKDTLYAAQIIKKWIIYKFSHLHNEDVTIIHLGQDGTNPSDFEQMFNWWRQTWRDKISIDENQSIWVCLKGGVGQTSEAARVSGLSFYSNRILFFEFYQNTKANRNGIPSDYKGPFLGTNYLWDRTQQQALKLLASYDYAETYDLLKPYFQQSPSTSEEILKLLKAGKLWNQGEFQRFLSVVKSYRKIPKLQGLLWMAYEQAYLAVIRLKQLNTTEAMLHSYRAIEGLLYMWAIESFPDDIEEEKNRYPSIKNSILEKYPCLKYHFNHSKCNKEILKGSLLRDLLQVAIPATVTSIDFQAFWHSAKDMRNSLSHCLGGLEEKEVFKAWGKDIVNLEQWQKRILNCINLVTGKSFKTLSQASVFSQVHTQLIKAISDYDISN